MPYFGAHISIAGGIERAPERGWRTTCEVIQVFTKSNVRWAAPPLTRRQCENFRAELEKFGIRLAFAHASYLVNLCSPDPAVRRRSRNGLATELRRCKALGLPYLVLHPGSHRGISERRALDWIVEGAAWAMEKVAKGKRAASLPMLLFETTAGQGGGFGWRFEQLAELLERSSAVGPVGVCFDTCHVFAAGYDIASPSGVRRTLAEFDRLVGLGNIKVVHLNDSKTDRGSRVDRHEHIGRGKIGLEGFRALVNEKRFADLPMVIETPKGKTPDDDIRNLDDDIRNLEILRSLVVRPKT